MAVKTLNDIEGDAGFPYWEKVTKNYTDFAAAGTENDIEIFSLSAGAMFHGMVIKHSEQFAGGGITAYTISAGIAADLLKYASAFDVFQAVADDTFQLSNNADIENWGSATSIRAKAASVGANLNQATQGIVEFYLLVSQVNK